MTETSGFGSKRLCTVKIRKKQQWRWTGSKGADEALVKAVLRKDGLPEQCLEEASKAVVVVRIVGFEDGIAG